MIRALASAEQQVRPVAEDERFAVDGRVRHLAAYDAGRPAGPRPDYGPGTDLVAADIDTVVAALPGRLTAVLAEHPDTRRSLLRQVRILLTWLQQFPGADWEQRWLASGVDCAPRSWTARLAADAPGSPALFSRALAILLLARVLRPSYSFMLNVKFGELFTRFPLVHDSEDFARLRALAPYRRAVTRAQIDAEAGLIRVLIRTGKHFADVTADDLLTYADLVKTSGRPRREHLLWELLVQAGPLAGEPMTLRAVWTAKGNSRQHDAAHVLDRYGLPPSPVRDVLIDYLTEIRPGLHSLLFRVRAFYRDLQQWALDEPARWGIWAVPSPVRDNDLRGLRKAKRHQQARTQQRTRVLTPLLPGLLAAATARRDWSVRLLAAATAAAHEEVFDVDGVFYRRFDPPARTVRLARCRTWLLRPDGSRFDVGATEADCFWAWALIETLRLTGCRIEEVLELTQLSLRHYTPPTTGTVVPLLHITPSKLDTERLVPMTPELVSVLLAVVRRARGNDARIPLSIRYDPHDRIHGASLPHLFSRPVGARHEVLSNHYVRTILNATADAAGLTDNGEPIRFTPHDFRRLFTTELVGAGLPIHIAATLLGHLNLDTTRGYTAVFPEQVIAAHHKMVEHRRGLRDSSEYRTVSPEEWSDFEQHFQLRRVALGDCFRPYGTPCVHEHACVRCPFLRLDPAQTPRLDTIEANTKSRLTEARGHQWLGEVAALEESLRHIRAKRTQLPDIATGRS